MSYDPFSLDLEDIHCTVTDDGFLDVTDDREQDI